MNKRGRSTAKYSISENQTVYSKNMKHFPNDGTEKKHLNYSLLKFFFYSVLVILLNITEQEDYFTDR